MKVFSDNARRTRLLERLQCGLVLFTLCWILVMICYVKHKQDWVIEHQKIIENILTTPDYKYPVK